MKVTPIEEIEAQIEPEIIEIPGFKAGATISVMVGPVELTPEILALLMANPLVSMATKRAKEGKATAETEEEMARDLKAHGGERFAELMPVMDAIAREALLQPTYEEIRAIRPLTFFQLIAIFTHAIGNMGELGFFRGQ